MVEAICESDIGPATVCAALHVAPPSVEEVKPTSSWQVDAVQLLLG
ncbi:hypothetical protein ACFU6I_25775 [Streptomyces sp. NPDC057486]